MTPDEPTVAHAIARALIDARVSLTTHVPGHGGTEVFRVLQDMLGSELTQSYNEEPAFALAHGAALAGRRSACLIKTHGYAKAANAVLSSLSAGTLAGLVIFAFDDPDGSHSDNVLPAENLVRATEVPFERLAPGDAYSQVLRAFERSEQMGLPYLLLVDCRDVSRKTAFEPSTAMWTPPTLSSDPALRVVCPPLAPFQRAVLKAKLDGAVDWRDRATPRPSLPRVPDDLPIPLQDAARAYVPIFEAFVAAVRSRTPRPMVFGDAGTSSLFAFPPYACVDACTYMGGSIPLATGAAVATGTRAWAVTGDFSFLAAGALGLMEATSRRAPVKVLVLDNGRAAATGGQKVERRLLEVLLAPYANSVRELPSGVNTSVAAATFVEADDADTLRIIVARC